MQRKGGILMATFLICLSLCSFACLGKENGKGNATPSVTESPSSSTESSSEENTSTENESVLPESSSPESSPPESSPPESSPPESSPPESSPPESSPPESSPSVPPESSSPHIHLYSVWAYNRETHWRTCACGAKEEEVAHCYQNGVCVCGKLEYYELSADGTYYIVTGWSTEREVVIPASYDGKPVKEIGVRAFYGKDITRLQIEGGVTKIGNGAFMGCASLTRVELSDSVTQIGSFAFKNCGALTQVVFANAEGWKAGAHTLNAELLMNEESAAKCLRGEEVNGYTYSTYIWTKEN